MERNYNLTEAEANVVKDILQAIGRDSEMEAQFAKAVGLSEPTFGKLTDSAFNKLGNGRLTVV